MNYKKTYDNIMQRAVGRKFVSGQHEKHHIVPRSLGGSNEKSNVVCLTYREHFLAHWLLTKFTEGNDLKKMQHALFRMTGKGNRHNNRSISSWQYSVSKAAQSKAMKGNKNGNGWEGKKHTEEWKRKASLRMKGKRIAKGYKQTEEHKLKNSGANNNKSSPVTCIDDGNKFDTIRDAAKFYHIKNIDGISAVCRGCQKTAGGLRFEYTNKGEKYNGASKR